MNTKPIVLVTSSLKAQFMEMTKSKTMRAFRKSNKADVANWHLRQIMDVGSYFENDLFIDGNTNEPVFPPLATWQELEGKLIVVDEVHCGDAFFPKALSLDESTNLPYPDHGRLLILDTKNGHQYIPHFMHRKDLAALEKLCQMEQNRIVDGVSYGEYSC